MINCRFFPGQPELHVHDDPGHINDILRCQDNGWTVWTDGECHVDGPFTSGDPGVRPPVILNEVNHG